MSLPSLIRVYAPGAESGPLDPADIFTSALGGIFTDDAQNSHGDPGAAVVYRPSWAAAADSNRSDTKERKGHSHGGDDDSTSQRDGDAKDGHTDDAEDGTLPTDLVLRLADPAKEDGRRLFAHYLWNASVLAAELVGRASVEASSHLPHASQSTTTTTTTETLTTDPTTSSTTCNSTEPSISSATDPPLPLGPKASSHNWSVRGHRVLELGAGTGLAGIVCGTVGGAAETWVTDYPARDVLDNIRANVRANIKRFERVRATKGTWSGTKGTGGLGGGDESGNLGAVKIKVAGHKWGEFDRSENDEGRSDEVENTREPDSNATDEDSTPAPHTFTRIIAADCLWMSGEHANLARSMSHFLSPSSSDAEVWVIAGFHTGRPKVVAFFDEVERQGELAVAARWEVGVDFAERDWDPDRIEDVGQRKRWLVVAILRRVGT